MKKKIGIVALVLFVLWAIGTYGGSKGDSASVTSASSAASIFQQSASSSVSNGKEELKIHFLDVGQGDSTLLESQGHWLLIDGGAPEASQKLYATLKAKDVNRLDAVIATHPDSDHIGGISGALNYATCGALYCSTDSNDSESFANMVKYNKPNGTTITIPKDGESFKFGDATVTFLRSSKSFSDENNNSLVARVDCGGKSVLFMGDAEADAEKALLADKKDLSVDILHVSHHGSLDSTSEEFLKAVNPKHAVVSVGKNDYGHPSERVMERLQTAGAKIYRTDQLGNVDIVCLGGSITVTTAKTSSESPTAPGKILTPVEVPTPAAIAEPEPEPDDQPAAPAGRAYVLNKNTKKFHYPGCASVSKMKASNREDVVATRDEIRSWGYDPCGNCKP